LIVYPELLMRIIRSNRRGGEAPFFTEGGEGSLAAILRKHRQWTNLLFVASSLFGDGSQSRLIASEFIDRWHQSIPARPW